MDGLVALDPSVMRHILHFLDVPSVCRTAQVCRAFRMAANCQYLWATLYRRHWGNTVPVSATAVLRKDKFDWKQTLQLRYEGELRWVGNTARHWSIDAHTDAITCVHFADGRIISGSKDGRLKVWEYATDTGPVLVQDFRLFTAAVLCLKCEGDVVVAGSSSGLLALFIFRGATLEHVATDRAHHAAVTCLDHIRVRAPQAPQRAVGTSPRRPSRTSPRRVPATSPRHTVGISPRRPAGTSPRRPSRTLHVSPPAPECLWQGKLATGSSDKTIKLWTWRIMRTVETEHVDAAGVAKSVGTPKSLSARLSSPSKTQHSTLASSSLECAGTLKGHAHPVECVQLSSEYVTSGADDGSIRVWDVRTMRQLCSPAQGERVWALLRSGSSMFTGHADCTVRSWLMADGASTWECCAILHGHTQPVTAVQVDGRKLVSASCDGTVKVWSVDHPSYDTGEEAKEVPTPSVLSTDKGLYLDGGTDDIAKEEDAVHSASALLHTLRKPAPAASPPRNLLSFRMRVKRATAKPSLAGRVRYAMEIRHWETIRQSSLADDYIKYLQKYPKGIFRDVALSRSSYHMEPVLSGSSHDGGTRYGVAAAGGRRRAAASPRRKAGPHVRAQTRMSLSPGVDREERSFLEWRKSMSRMSPRTTGELYRRPLFPPIDSDDDGSISFHSAASSPRHHTPALDQSFSRLSSHSASPLPSEGASSSFKSSADVPPLAAAAASVVRAGDDAGAQWCLRTFHPDAGALLCLALGERTLVCGSVEGSLEVFAVEMVRLQSAPPAS